MQRQWAGHSLLTNAQLKTIKITSEKEAARTHNWAIEPKKMNSEEYGHSRKEAIGVLLPRQQLKTFQTNKYKQV